MRPRSGRSRSFSRPTSPPLLGQGADGGDQRLDLIVRQLVGEGLHLDRAAGILESRLDRRERLVVGKRFLVGAVGQVPGPDLFPRLGLPRAVSAMAGGAILTPGRG